MGQLTILLLLVAHARAIVLPPSLLPLSPLLFRAGLILARDADAVQALPRARSSEMVKLTKTRRSRRQTVSKVARSNRFDGDAVVVVSLQVKARQVARRQTGLDLEIGT